jgi:hypothetical protein
MDQAQELRDHLEAILDLRTSTIDRRNAIYMLMQRLQVLDRELLVQELAEGR